jgi:hypothetical protein
MTPSPALRRRVRDVPNAGEVLTGGTRVDRAAGRIPSARREAQHGFWRRNLVPSVGSRVDPSCTLDESRTRPQTAPDRRPTAVAAVDSAGDRLYRTTDWHRAQTDSTSRLARGSRLTGIQRVRQTDTTNDRSKGTHTTATATHSVERDALDTRQMGQIAADAAPTQNRSGTPGARRARRYEMSISLRPARYSL